MRHFIILFCTSLSLVFTSACDSGGTQYPRANYCAENYNPQLKLTSTLTVLENEGASKAQTIDLYFSDTDRDIRLHLRRTVNAEGEAKITTECIGGRGFYNIEKVGPVNESFPTITEIQGADSGKLLITLGAFVVDIKKRTNPEEPLLKFSFEPDLDSFEGVPQKPYESYVNLEQKEVLSEEGHITQLRTTYTVLTEEEKNAGKKGIKVINRTNYK